VIELEAELDGLASLAESGGLVASGGSFAASIAAVARAVVAATDAEAAVVWLRDPGGELVAHAVASASSALAAELEGARAPAAALDAGGLAAVAGAGRVGEWESVCVPIETDAVLGALELLRPRTPFGDGERSVARLAASQVALACLLAERAAAGSVHGGSLEIAGDALAAAADEHAADRIARLAAQTTGAQAALLWRAEPGRRRADLVAAHEAEDVDRPALDELAREVLREPAAVMLDFRAAAPGVVASLQLGQPPLGVLQLVFPEGREPREAELERLTTFAVRAAHALRAGERAREVEAELDRSRALLAVVGQAIAQLSLIHTLETAVERVADLVGAERVAVYLAQEDGGLVAPMSLGLAGPHEVVARRLLELALGPSRGRGIVRVGDAATDARLARVRAEVLETGVESALGVPLVAHGEVIGLLAAFPPRSRQLSASESTLLVAVSAQLAVAVQNAQLHERAKLLGTELEAALGSEREAARRLRALYEISRSFTQSLSLETTLDAVVEAVVATLDVDAAVIRMPDERGAELTVRAAHVADERVSDAARLILGRPQPLTSATLRKLLRTRRPIWLDAATAAEMGGSYALLAPFLEKGSTVAVVPIATPGEVLGTLSIVSFHPGSPITETVVEGAASIAQQAALALDNARLYSQQKEFADTMQRSLLPRSAPVLQGLELGDVYESSARVDVGGDVYDYLELGDGKLAVVLGDVTGHGIDATADMAMAKFIFRSLARERPDPSQFLAAANEVVVGEIAPGKFITMVYVAIDAEAGTIRCASAGHPPPRLVLPDGTVQSIPARGLALGIDDAQEYEAVEVEMPPGAALVLYTDGAIEARRDGELFGTERFDALLSANRALPAREIALAVLEACRDFTVGELADDLAVVVIKRAE
jgi:serine phosphatase RsbU (regulator of sigma subunit)